MSEPDITALARRLAEQNNVDWRGLSGSGDGGKIVERDVLDYLARVMAGEEAVNPTPEPMPEGMQAWPDQDIGAFRQGVGEAASLGDLRSEIGNAVRDEPATDQHPLAGVSASEPALDEDVFLFDDEPAGGEEPSAAAAEPLAAPVAGDDLEDLLVSGDEPIPSMEAEAAGPGLEAVPYESGAAPSTGPHDTGDQWGSGISLGEGRAADVDPVAGSDVWGEPAAPSDDIDLFAEVGGAVDVSDDVDLFGAGASGDAAAHDIDLFADDPSAGAPDAGSALDSDQEAAPWSADSPWAVDDEPSAGAESTSALEAEEPWAPETSASDAAASDAVDEREPFAAEPAELARGLDPEPEELAAFAPEVDGSDEALPDLAGPALAGVTAAEGLPLARVSTVLRRHVDVSALAAAQLAASQELGKDEPLAAAPFVLRAVAKAARGMEAAFGQVALATFEDGMVLRRVDGAASRPFAEVVDELAGQGAEEDEAGLVVADLSVLDLDEVVLDVGLPVLSLGRILYDNQRGGYRSTLTLAGDVPAETGAKLLARVAELLDAPVRLVM